MTYDPTKNMIQNNNGQTPAQYWEDTNQQHEVQEGSNGNSHVAVKESVLETPIGEVQAEPTLNTVLGRLKSLEDKLDSYNDGNNNLKVSLNSSNSSLVTLSERSLNDADETILAGGDYQILTREIRKDYKQIRVIVSLSFAADFVIRLVERETAANYNFSSDNYVDEEFNNKSGGRCIFEICSDKYDAYVVNQSAGNITLKSWKITGVK